MELESIFINATNHARTFRDVSENHMLQLYGLYKQSKEGDCNISKPYFWDFTATAKWKSWKSFSQLHMSEAKRQYIALVKDLDPDWDETLDVLGETENRESGGMGVSVSTLARDAEKVILDEDKTIFDWCEVGELNEMKRIIINNNEIIHSVDCHRLSLLHWAVDRGYSEIVQHLINVGCNVNSRDEDQQTPLHYAATCEHEDIVQLLLNAGADRTLKDIDGNTPSHCTSNSHILSLFCEVNDKS